MKKLTKAVILSCILFIVSACTGNPPSPITSQATKVIEPTILPSLPYPTITATELNPTGTILFTQTTTNSPIPTLDTGIKQNCLPVISTIPEDFNYSGVITGFTHPNSDGPGSFSLMNLKTKTTHNIKAGSYISGIAVSPDHRMYAYQIDKARQIAIFTSDGRIKKIIASPKDWYLSRWFDNQKLLLTISEPDPFIDPKVRAMDKYPQKIALLNLFSKESQVFPPDYPNIDRTTWSTSFDGSGTTLYDPTFTRMVYPGQMGDGGAYVLWDVPGKKIIAKLYSYTWGISPLWSPDGSKFIVNGQGGEFYLVSRDGDIKKITHYNPDYVRDENRYNVYSRNYDWNPDGVHVALWLNTIEPKSATLAILNTLTGETDDLCITFGEMPKWLSFSTPVWSPDGNYLILDANHQPSQNTDDLILVDLEKNTAIKIAENFSPNGWLIEP